MDQFKKIFRHRSKLLVGYKEESLNILQLNWKFYKWSIQILFFHEKTRNDCFHQKFRDNLFFAAWKIKLFEYNFNILTLSRICTKPSHPMSGLNRAESWRFLFFAQNFVQSHQICIFHMEPESAKDPVLGKGKRGAFRN